MSPPQQLGDGDGTDTDRVPPPQPPSPQRTADRKPVVWPRSSRRRMPVLPARAARTLGRAAGRSLTRLEEPMTRSLYIVARERCWNRDRRRRIAEMHRRERASFIAHIDWVEAMAIQLAEIRTLPEAFRRGAGRPISKETPPMPIELRRQSSAQSLDPSAGTAKRPAGPPWMAHPVAPARSDHARHVRRRSRRRAIAGD